MPSGKIAERDPWLKGVHPTRVFCAKSAEISGIKGVTILRGAKECVRV